MKIANAVLYLLLCILMYSANVNLLFFFGILITVVLIDILSYTDAFVQGMRK